MSKPTEPFAKNLRALVVDSEARYPAVEHIPWPLKKTAPLFWKSATVDTSSSTSGSVLTMAPWTSTGDDV